MANTRVMSAPLGIVKSNGLVIGKMKSIRCTESIRRSPVQTIGRLAAEELVATGWTGELSCGYFLVDFSQQTIPGSLLRTVQTIQQFEDTITLDSTGVEIDIMRKVVQSQINGIITPQLEVFATISGAFIDSEDFDINEGQISSRNQRFSYINPILFQL